MAIFSKKKKEAPPPKEAAIPNGSPASQRSTQIPQPSRARMGSINQGGPLTSSTVHYPWAKRQINLLPMVLAPKSTLPPQPSPAPFPRYGHSVNPTATYPSGDLYIFGGLANNDVSKDLYVLNCASSINSGSSVSSSGTDEALSAPAFDMARVETRGDGPSARVGHTSVSVGNVLIVWGGDTKFSPDDVLDNELYLLNLSTREWTRVKISGPVPEGRYGHSSAMLGTKFFIFGGQRDDGSFTNDIAYFDLHSLKTGHPAWTIIHPTEGLPNPPVRTGHTLVAYNDAVYVFGGTDGQYHYNDTWSFDINTGAWTELSCIGYIPLPREGHAATLVDDVMYVFGGRGVDGMDLSDLAAFKLRNRRWFMFQNMGPAPTGRSGHAMATYRNKVFILGGESYDPGSTDGSPKQEIDPSAVYVLDTGKIKYPQDPAATRGLRKPSLPNMRDAPNSHHNRNNSTSNLPSGASSPTSSTNHAMSNAMGGAFSNGPFSNLQGVSEEREVATPGSQPPYTGAQAPLYPQANGVSTNAASSASITNAFSSSNSHLPKYQAGSSAPKAAPQRPPRPDDDIYLSKRDESNRTPSSHQRSNTGSDYHSNAHSAGETYMSPTLTNGAYKAPHLDEASSVSHSSHSHAYEGYAQQGQSYAQRDTRDKEQAQQPFQASQYPSSQPYQGSQPYQSSHGSQPYQNSQTYLDNNAYESTYPGTRPETQQPYSPRQIESFAATSNGIGFTAPYGAESTGMTNTVSSQSALPYGSNAVHSSNSAQSNSQAQSHSGSLPGVAATAGVVAAGAAAVGLYESRGDTTSTQNRGTEPPAFYQASAAPANMSSSTGASTKFGSYGVNSSVSNTGPYGEGVDKGTGAPKYETGASNSGLYGSPDAGTSPGTFTDVTRSAAGSATTPSADVSLSNGVSPSDATTNAWLRSALALAVERGFILPSDTAEAPAGATTTPSPPLELLLALKAELADAKADALAAADATNAKLAMLVKSRTIALQEAAYYRAKLALVSGTASDGNGGLSALESERAADLETRLADALSAHGTAQQRNTRLTAELEHERAMRAAAEERHMSAVRRADAAESEHAQARAAHADTTRELHAKGAGIAAAATAAVAATAEIAQLRKALAASSTRADELRALWESTGNRLAAAEAAAAEADSARTRDAAALASATARVSELERALKAAEDANAAGISVGAGVGAGVLAGGVAGVTVSHLNRDSDEGNEDATVSRAVADVTTNGATDTTESSAALLSELKEAHERETALHATSAQLRAELTSLRAQLTAALDELTQHKTALQDKEAELSEHSRARETAEMKAGVLKSILGERGETGERSTSTSQVSDMQARISELENSLQQRTQAYQALQAAKAESERQLAGTDGQSTSSELEALQERHKQLEQTHLKAVQYVKGTEKMLRRMKDELTRYKSKNEQLEKQLQDMHVGSHFDAATSSYPLEARDM